MALDAALATKDYCYLTTKGRRTGRKHTIEIWFALRGSTLYMLAGGRERADWVLNMRKTPAVTIRVGETLVEGKARVIDGGEEERLARRLVFEKYSPGYGDDLSGWRYSALPIAIDL